MELFQSMEETDDTKWKEHSSFFMSLQGEMDLDFSDKAKVYKPKLSLDGLMGTDMFDSLLEPHVKDINLAEGVPMIFGIVKDFRPTVKELKVFDKKRKAKVDEANVLNEKIMNLKNLAKTNTVLKMVSEQMFGQGFPMIPFPEVERCLGLNAKDSSMRIEEGFAIMAFDYKVMPSRESCIFDMRDTLTKKELRMANKNKGKKGFDIGSATRGLKKAAKDM